MFLVTGGAGFVGSHIVDALVARGDRVRILENFATGTRGRVNPRAELFESDLSDLEKIRPAFAGITGVFHTAALPRVPFSIEHPVESHVANALGTLRALMAARDAGVRRFINSGSSSVYGDQPTLPLKENMLPNPLNPYAVQKLVGEHYTHVFHQLFGLETLTLRYFNVFGPRMAIEGAYVTVISIFLRQKRQGQPLTIHGDGEQTRDFTHVRDVVRANLLAMESATADGRPLNIGQGKGVSINRIAAMFGGEVVHLPPRLGDVRHTLADFSEAERILGWRPQVSTEEGIRELLANL